MHSILTRIVCALFILVFFCSYSTFAATEQRTALVIGNSAYRSGPLKNPVNDAEDIANALLRVGFKVTLKKNANLQTMEEAIEDFGNQLKRGGVGLFFYAGHGVQVNNINYLLPVNARINKESDVRFQSVDAGRVLAEMENANNGLNIVILDACRDNPFGKIFRSASRGLAIIANSPAGTFISYSTGAGQVARDGAGRNSPYTKALLENIDKSGLSINDVFMKVRSKVKRETGQVPWELSSLEGNFYFVPPVLERKNAEVEDDAAETKSVKEALDEENRKLEADERRLTEEKATLAKQKELVDKRRKIAEERKRLAAEQRRLEAEKESLAQKNTLDEKSKKTGEEKKDLQKVTAPAKESAILAMSKRPGVSAVSEIGRDGRFIAYHDGTVLDTKTNLMWASKDNGANIGIDGAKYYCGSFRGGGYTDWRMPVKNELASLYDSSKSRPTACDTRYNLHIATEFIDITCYNIWTLDTNRNQISYFDVTNGLLYWENFQGLGFVPRSNSRALPVRFAK